MGSTSGTTLDHGSLELGPALSSAALSIHMPAQTQEVTNNAGRAAGGKLGVAALVSVR